MIRISALILIAIGTASAADVTGKWNVTATSPSGSRQYNLTLDLKEEAGKLSGTMSGPDGAVALQDVKLEGDQLTYTVPAGSGYKIKMTLADGSMKGTYTGNDGVTGPAVATRAAAASGIAGKWKAYAKAESGREYNVELNLATDNDKVTGSLIAPEGDVSITDGKLDGDQFSFRLLLDEGAYAVKLTVAGDTMSGAYTGPGGEKGKVTARR
ncbi:MAG TPA: hypothetical protein VN442_05750 [Bryobacteraceae bacterium]|nr:hypothetical protein [Bryobacteraceae bacterium]